MPRSDGLGRLASARETPLNLAGACRSAVGRSIRNELDDRRRSRAPRRHVRTEPIPEPQSRPRNLEADSSSRTHGHRDLRPQPRRRHCPGKGVVLGHAGRQRRRAVLRHVPLPRGRRSSFRQPAEPGRRRQSRPGHRLGRPELSAEGVGLPPARVADPTDRQSKVLRDVDDVVSSQGCI